MINRVLPRSCRGIRCGERLTNDASAPHRGPDDNAFTLIELILAVGIILVLSGLVLSTVGYARKKSARARAETEIAAMSAAIENYKADNGVYPRGNANLSNNTPYDTDTLDPVSDLNPAATPIPNVYTKASLYLYKQLSGDSAGNRQVTGKSYLTFKANMLYPDDQTQNVQYIRDPFGDSYGYSTMKASGGTDGYNPTFDLWSTAGAAPSPTPNPPATQQGLWIKNW
jgi:prepilin-type N-terminal cleavage/methylation domain-containing protein